MSSLEDFLSFYLPGIDLTPFTERFHYRTIKKSKLLITPGKKVNLLAFIQQGSFRVYYPDLKGKEITTWFSFEGMVVTDLLAFYTGERATFYVQAIEDSELYVIERKELEDLYELNPLYSDFGRKFAEEALTMLMYRTLSLHTKTPATRYKELLSQPEYMQKIPLKHLASFLGITDSSLSRLRRKVR